MDKPKSVKPKTGHIYIVYEMLAFEHKLIVRVPIPANSQNLRSATLYCDYIRFSDTIVGVINSINNNIGMNFVQRISIIGSYRIPLLFGLPLLYISMERPGVPNLYIPVKPINLKFPQFVLGLTHNMRNTFSTLYMGRAVRNNHILRRNINRNLSPYIRIKIHLFESRPRKPQTI